MNTYQKRGVCKLALNLDFSVLEYLVLLAEQDFKLNTQFHHLKLPTIENSYTIEQHVWYYHLPLNSLN